MNSIPLLGCAPVPLVHYLKALGVLRLVNEQFSESQVLGAWHKDIFVLEGELDEAALIHFFLHDYQPTPIIAPWNGGSGFYYQEGKSKEKDTATGKKLKTGTRDQPTAATRAVDAILESQTVRLLNYRNNLAQAKAVLSSLGYAEAPKEEEKAELILRLRNVVDDNVLDWFDAVFVLTGDAVKFPPLLGTGGNDGNTDFTSNFMQRLADVFDFIAGKETKLSEHWLQNALLGTTSPDIPRNTIGQFYPGGAGGFNSSSGFDGHSVINPWDYILALEGAVLFAAAGVKRLGVTGDGTLVYPFCVRQAGVGYGSASASDETDARCEMWMPLWERPTNLAELQALLSEGRAQVNGRPARTGVDFMRAAVSLGVDRGISGFQRYGFQVRNGLAYFATPLDRVAARRNEKVDLLSEVEGWLDRFRSKAASTNPEPPSSITRSLRVLEDTIFGLCRSGEPSKVQQVFVALGQCEKAMARSLRWTRESAFLKPITGLSTRWLHDANTHSVEFRLASALASTAGRYDKEWLPLRAHLEPVAGGISKEKTWFNWLEIDSNDVCWHEGSPVEVMNEIFARRLVRTEQAGLRALPDNTQIPVSLGDIAAFIEGQINDDLFADLLWACSLIDHTKQLGGPIRAPLEDSDLRPPAFYALLKLSFAGRLDESIRIPLQPAIHQRAVAGDALQASEMAARRLRASGVAPAIERAPLGKTMTCRAAAALLFPLAPRQIDFLRKIVARPSLQPIA